MEYKEKDDVGGTFVQPAYAPDAGSDPEKAYRVDHTGTTMPGMNLNSESSSGEGPPHAGPRLAATTATALTPPADRGEMEGGVKRSLKQRHMAMIAIGGAIGTGEFCGVVWLGRGIGGRGEWRQT